MTEPTPIQLTNALEAYAEERSRWAIGRRGSVWVVERLVNYRDMDVLAEHVGAVKFEKEATANGWLHERCLRSALTVAMHGRARRPRLDP